MLVFLSDEAYNFLVKKSSHRKLHVLIEWLSTQKYKDTRILDFKETDDIRKNLNLPMIWYMNITPRTKRNIRITTDTLARLAAIAIIFEITRPLDSQINYYLTPVQLAGYTLEAIGSKSLTPLQEFPTFYITKKKKVSEYEYKEIIW